MSEFANEIKEIVKSLDGIDAKIEQVSKDNEASITAIKSEIKTLGEKQVEMSHALIDAQQKSVNAMAETATADNSAGAMFVKSANYGRLKQDMQHTERAREIIKSATASVLGEGYTATRDTIATPYNAGVVGQPDLPLLIEGLIPHVPVSTGSIQYVRDRSNSNGAQVVAEGTRKPETQFDFEAVNAPIVTVAHWAKITEQLAADAPAVAAYINRKMMYKLALKVDNQLITGNGSATELSGFLNTGNHTDYSGSITPPTGSTLIDFALLLKTRLETEGYAPRTLVLNPSDWAALALLKDSQKRYLLGGPAAVTDKVIWGTNVVTSSSMTAGKYLMADFALGSTIFDRQEMAVEMARESDDFIKNIFTIRVERRLGLVVDTPAAIAGGDWALGS